MKIQKLIETEQEYETAIRRIDAIFDAPEGSKEADELKLLVLLVKKYEEENYPMPEPDPIEAILLRMEELGLERKDLEPFIGDKTIVSKVLNRKRDLTVKMIRNLHQGLRLPAEVLIAPPVHRL
ncbi:helix-turn-helix domain-containing protein [Botryobacter ruber]|uniref:helix-turn-helix domain-containing protein n=1 Tax=Botryobacter ruber TaxID=2171629 RepID=UPI000E0C38C5|nr:transcriptional regulator [Botryobacter ruber]